jgi:hypothetical protein
MLKRALAATALMLGAGLSFVSTPAAAANACRGDNGGLKLSPGWCATIFADKVGHARQMVVAPNGVLYVNTWSGVYYDNDKPPAGGFVVALKDSKGTGRADVIKRFGDRHLLLQRRALCRRERQDRALRVAERRDRA